MFASEAESEKKTSSTIEELPVDSQGDDNQVPDGGLRAWLVVLGVYVLSPICMPV